MKKLELIFVTPRKNGHIALVSRLVCFVTGSKWSHTAGYLFGGVYEAVMPQITINEPDKYANEKCMEVVTIMLSDSDHMRLENKARELLGLDAKYGLWDCLCGGLATLFGHNVGKLLNGGTSPRNKVCSSTWAYLLLASSAVINKRLRDCGITMSNHELTTPQELYAACRTIQKAQEERALARNRG